MRVHLCVFTFTVAELLRLHGWRLAIVLTPGIYIGIEIDYIGIGRG